MERISFSPVVLLGGTGMILVALGFVAFALWRRLSWKYLLFGALMWIVTVAVKFAIAIPFNSGIYRALTGALPGGIGNGIFDLYVGALTGVTEVLIVWLLMRYTRLGKVAWERALAFGIGFGAVEALLLGLVSFSTGMAMLLAPQSIPSETLAQLAVMNDPLWAIAPPVERFFTVWVHIFCNVLIFFGVARSQSRWFWFSFAVKSLLDAWAGFGQTAGMTATLGQIWILEAGVILFGILAWYGVLWVARRYKSVTETTPAPGPARGRVNWLVVSLVAIAFVFIVVIAGAAVLSFPQSRGLSDSEKQSVLTYSEAKTDNLIAGLNGNDYATFSRDFDPKMKAAMTQAQFGNTQKQVIGKIGKYISRRVDRIEQSGEFIAVVYVAKFEQDEPVTLRVVYTLTEPHQVTGLWFDSAKLRQQ